MIQLMYSNGLRMDSDPGYQKSLYDSVIWLAVGYPKFVVCSYTTADAVCGR